MLSFWVSRTITPFCSAMFLHRYDVVNLLFLMSCETADSAVKQDVLTVIGFTRFPLIFRLNPALGHSWMVGCCLYLRVTLQDVAWLPWADPELSTTARKCVSYAAVPGSRALQHPSCWRCLRNTPPHRAASPAPAHQLPAQVFLDLISEWTCRRAYLDRRWRRRSWCCQKQRLCSKDIPPVSTWYQPCFFEYEWDGKRKIIKASSYLISGRPQISGFNTLLHLKVLENFSRFLPKGDLSSIFLCYCEVLSLFKSTLVGNCVGYRKLSAILNQKSCTLQINPKLPWLIG